MPETPTPVFDPMNPVTVRGVKKRLVGLEAWLQGAAIKGYTDEDILESIGDALSEFENEARMRIRPSQIAMTEDAVYNGTFGVEGTLELPLTVERFDRLSYFPEAASQWYRLELPASPVRQIQRLQFWLGTLMIYQVPAHWIRFNREDGTLHLLPFTSALQSAYGAAGAVMLLNSGFGGQGAPHVMSVDYVAGLPDDWDKQPRWRYLRRGLEECAALKVLYDIAHVFGAGMSSQSLNTFGVGQNDSYDRFQIRNQELEQASVKLLETAKPNADFLNLECL